MSLGDEVGHGLSKSLSSSVGHGGCLRVDIGLGHGLGGGVRPFNSLGVVDNFSRHPDASSWHNFDRGNYLGDLLDISHGLGDCLVHGNCRRDSLGVHLS